MCKMRFWLPPAAALGLIAMPGCNPSVETNRPALQAAATNDVSNALDATQALAERRFHYGTRSIAACDPATGECGIAVVTFPSSVGAVVPAGDPGVAIANQAWPNIYTARAIQQAVLAGVHPTAALESALATDPDPGIRQFA